MGSHYRICVDADGSPGFAMQANSSASGLEYPIGESGLFLFVAPLGTSVPPPVTIRAAASQEVVARPELHVMDIWMSGVSPRPVGSCCCPGPPPRPSWQLRKCDVLLRGPEWDLETYRKALKVAWAPRSRHGSAFA